MQLANRSKALVMALALVASVLAAGGAVAATETLDDSTYTVNNDTQSVYTEVTGTNMSGTTTATASVTYYGVNSDGVATQVGTSSVTVENDTTTLDEYSTLNTTKYDEYRVTVEGNATLLEVETGTISKAAGGGSVLGLDGALDSLPGSPIMLGAALAAIVGVLALVRD